jgi:hypothetical protein
MKLLQNCTIQDASTMVLLKIKSKERDLWRQSEKNALKGNFYFLTFLSATNVLRLYVQYLWIQNFIYLIL